VTGEGFLDVVIVCCLRTSRTISCLHCNHLTSLTNAGQWCLWELDVLLSC